MSRSKHGHRHVGRAKCSACSLAGVRGARQSAQESERALEADEPFVVASNYQPHAVMAAAGVPFPDPDDGYGYCWDDDWLEAPEPEPVTPFRVPLSEVARALLPAERVG